MVFRPHDKSTLKFIRSLKILVWSFYTVYQSINTRDSTEGLGQERIVPASLSLPLSLSSPLSLQHSSLLPPTHHMHNGTIHFCTAVRARTCHLADWWGEKGWRWGWGWGWAWKRHMGCQWEGGWMDGRRQGGRDGEMGRWSRGVTDVLTWKAEMLDEMLCLQWWKRPAALHRYCLLLTLCLLVFFFFRCAFYLSPFSYCSDAISMHLSVIINW